MSHSFKGTEGTQFHFDGGLEGNIHVIAVNGEEVEIPAKDIIDLVAYEYVLPRKVSELEQAAPEHLLQNIY